MKVMKVEIKIVVLVGVPVIRAVPIHIHGLEIRPDLVGPRHPILTRQPEYQRQEDGPDHIRPQKSVESHPAREDRNDLAPSRHFTAEIDHRDKHHQRIDHRHDERDEPDIIQHDQLLRIQPAPHKIVGLLARIDDNGNSRDHQYRKNEGPKKFF